MAPDISAPILNRMSQLMDQNDGQRDLDWLESMLQAAVTLEFATIPLYFTALWSIKDREHWVAKSIRNVVQEEMLHMSLVCNMLRSLGRTPNIAGAAPSYPTHLPGHVRPRLKLHLHGYSPKQIHKFTELEAPEDHARKAASDEYLSVGDFYDAISAAFLRQNRPVSVEGQISGPLASMIMHDQKSIQAAIRLIKEQGEGSSVSPLVPHTHDVAHYYRFLEIHKSRRIAAVVDGKPIYEGPRLPQPEVWPVVDMHKGKYRAETVPPRVAALMREFDAQYTEVLNLLQSTWEDGGQAALIQGIGKMFSLEGSARVIMGIRIRGSEGHYGPRFHYLA